jgi:hypothetical protein
MDCLNNSLGRASSIPLEGPAAWGGVAAGILQHHTRNPDLLTSTLQVAEALLEYAQAQGLSHMASLVQSAHQQIDGRHCILRSTAPESSHLHKGSAKADEQHNQEEQQQQGQGLEPAHPQQQPPTLQQCLRAVLLGFSPRLEQQYGVWLGTRYSLIRNTWRATFLLLVACGALKSLAGDRAEALACLRASLLLVLPYSVGLYMSCCRGVNR